MNYAQMQMEHAGVPPDDLDVRLRWPDEDPASLGRQYRRPDADPSADTEDPTDQPERDWAVPSGETSDFEPRDFTTDVAVAARTGGDAPHAALASIAVRLDALTSATALLRNVVGDRLVEYGEQAMRAQAANGRDLDDYRRLNERFLADIEAGLGASEEAIRRLERIMSSASAELDRMGHNVDLRLGRVQELLEDLANGSNGVDLGPLLERLGELTDRMDRLGQPGGLSAIEESIADLHDGIEGLAERPDPPGPDLTPLKDVLDGIHDTIEALAARPEPLPTDLTPVQHVLDGIHNTIEALAQRPEPLPTDLTPLKNVLDGIHGTIEALAQRPEALPTDLTPLKNVLDGIHDTIEALAQRPEPQPTDLTPLNNVLDGIHDTIEALAQRPEPQPTDLTALHEILSSMLDSLEELADQPEPPAPDLVPVLEGLSNLQRSVADLSDRPGPEPVDLTGVQSSQAFILDAVKELLASAEEAGPEPVDLSPVQGALAAVEESLGGIRETLAGMDEALADLADEVAAPAVDLGPTQVALADLQVTVSALAERPDSEATDLGPVLVAIADLRAVLQQQAASIAGLTSRATDPGLEGRVQVMLERLGHDQLAASERVLAVLASVEAGQETARDELQGATAAQVAAAEAQQAAAEAQQAAAEAQQGEMTAITKQLNRMAKTDKGPADRGNEAVQAAIEEASARLQARVDASTVALVDEVQAISKSVDALRRRLAVRARPEPVLSDDALTSLADAVARRLIALSTPPPAEAVPGPSVAKPPVPRSGRRGSSA